jgi:hypothetical protein
MMVVSVEKPDDVVVDDGRGSEAGAGVAELVAEDGAEAADDAIGPSDATI